jgi:hypothetical protein
VGRANEIVVTGGLGGAFSRLGSATSAVSSETSQGTTAFRYMTQGEVNAIKESKGYLRGGNPGETFFTKDLYKSAFKAEQRLSLGTTPTHRVEFEILNNPLLSRTGQRVAAIPGRTGGGNEFSSLGLIRVRIINIQPLNPIYNPLFNP